MMWILDKDGDGVNLDLVSCLIACKVESGVWQLRADFTDDENDCLKLVVGTEKEVKAARDKILAKLLDPDLTCPTTHEPIMVWAFYDAPANLQALSGHGGDEDWLAILPPDYKGEMPSWMQSGTPFGCCDVSVKVLGDGRTICIGAHA